MDNLQEPTSLMINEIESLLREMNKMIRRKGRESLSMYAITPPQFDALLLIKEYGDLTIGELSSKMYLAYSTTTDLVDRMERNLLVERIRDQQDRRIVRLHMLDRGKQIIADVLSARQSFLTTKLQRVSEESLKEWLSSLSAIHKHMTV